MKWLFYVIVFVYLFYRAVYGKPENGLTVLPVKYGALGFLPAGEHTNLNCRAPNRRQKVEWFDPNGRVVRRIPGNRIYSQEHIVSSFKGRTPALVLTITKAEVQDTGVYQCRFGNNSQNVSLCVIEPSEFVDTVTEVSADIRRSITLSCQAKGEPEPRLVWNRNGETITDDDSSAKYRVMTKYNIEGFEGLLTIISLEAEDSGLYSCVSIQESTQVENCSYTQMHNITLNINYAPVFEGGNDTIVYWKNNQEVDIVCSAEGFPTPTYRLFELISDATILEFNQNQIKYNEDINEAVLTIKPNLTTLQHMFKCIATNDQGSAEKHFTIVEMEEPSKIHEVKISNIHSKAVQFNVTWNDDVVFPVTAFDIQYIQDSNGDKKRAYSRTAWKGSKEIEVKEDIEHSELGGILVTLGPLEEDTSYWVRLRATNDVGVSPWSDPVFASTSDKEEEIQIAKEENRKKTDKVPEEPKASKVNNDNNKASNSTFYGIFFAGGILVVAFVYMLTMRMVK